MRPEPAGCPFSRPVLRSGIGLTLQLLQGLQSGDGTLHPVRSHRVGGGINTYGYVSNKPLEYIDPTGLFYDSTGQILGQLVKRGVGVGAAGIAGTIGTAASFLLFPSGLGDGTLTGSLPAPTYPDDSFIGRNGLPKVIPNGEPLACDINDRDRCKDLIFNFLKLIWSIKTSAMSGTSGLYYRFQMQKCDSNNLYNKRSGKL